MSVKSPREFPRDNAPEGTDVWVERTAERELTGFNVRGVSIPIGRGEGRITPGELLKLSLIGCAGMTMDNSAAHRLGEDFALRITARATSDEKENRYLDIAEEIELDLSGLTEDEQARLADLLSKVIGRGCTVERTVTADPAIRHTIINAAEKDQNA